MEAKERRKLENNLMQMGLSGMDDPDLCTVFAAVVDEFPGDKHWFFRGMINECEPDKRYEMYHALRPKFTKFKPLPLDTYLAQLAEEAGAMVSQRRVRVEGSAPHPIEIAGHMIEITRGPANTGWCALRCHLCERVEKFLGDTPVGAIINAREKGWRRDPLLEHETCPECIKCQDSSKQN